jgi:hypothetical protein
MIFTPYLSRIPCPASSEERLRPDWPPRFGRSASGRFHRLHGQRFDIGGIGHARVGHDGGRIGVDQHDLVAKVPKRLAGLGAGIVELAGLADHDGTGADDHDFVDILSFWHGILLWKWQIVNRKWERLFG